MRLVTFLKDGEIQAGIWEEGGIVPLSAMPDMPQDVLATIRGGEEVRSRLEAVMANGAAGQKIDPSSVTLLAPIPRPPRNIFCVGKNYTEHAKEF